MNQRKAKQDVCGYTAGLLRSALDVGGLSENVDGGDVPPEDLERLELAAEELVSELERRAGK